MSRTAARHPKGETCDVSMGLRGFLDTLTKIAAQPEKDCGDLVRQRRGKRGLPVAPAGKVLPFLPVWSNDDPVAVLDAAAEVVFAGDSPPNEVRLARVRLACVRLACVRLAERRMAERRMAEALLALEQAGVSQASAREVAQLEQIYAQELAAYRAVMQPEHLR